MIIRGVYTTEEEQMLEDWMKMLREESCWMGQEITPQTPYPVLNRVASKDLIRKNALGIDDRNPLWSDEQYAINTKWGGIIAPPLFPYVICYGGPAIKFKVPQSVGNEDHIPGGTRWEFFKPIHADDFFKVRTGINPSIEDATSPDGNGPRIFYIYNGMKFINQYDETVCISYKKSIRIITRPDEAKWEKPADPMCLMSDYKYSDEELELLNRMHDEEELRGANPRYWEDVNIGDDLKPIAYGPITVWDQILEMVGRGVFFANVREIGKKTPQFVRIVPETGVMHNRSEMYMVDRVAKLVGHPMARVGRDIMEQVLCRIVTNWMGDDGFLKVYSFQQEMVIPIGDAFFCRGKVINKRVENGEHLVDIRLWQEALRGFVIASGFATVSLDSRQNA